MKTPKEFSTTASLLCAVASGLVLVSATGTAQTFTVVKSFGNLTNIEAANPLSQLAQGPDGTLYGTTSAGGESSVGGTVFKIQPDGSGFAVLKSFTNSVEGQSPGAGLSLSGNTLFGTTISGGNSNAGTVFRVTTDGKGFAVLKHFAGNDSDGAYPLGSLVLSGNVLYGTTSQRGGNGFGWGAVFKLNTNGTGYTVLKEFGEWDGSSGLLPFGRLTLLGDVLYGTTLTGGSGGGTVFKINTDGTGFCTLKSFTGAAGEASNPGAGLTLSDGVLYGTTMGGGSTFYTGGSSGVGTVFKLNTDGTGYSVLREFTGSDGTKPRADLILSAGVLYGTTSAGGRYDGGTVFKVNTNGTGYAVLKHFTGLPGDGGGPVAGLTLVGRALYGTTERGGSLGLGTAFKLELSAPVSLTAQLLGNAIILTWSDPAFVLQAAPAVTRTYTSIPDATSPCTNVISEPQMFFQLVGN